MQDKRERSETSSKITPVNPTEHGTAIPRGSQEIHVPQKQYEQQSNVTPKSVQMVSDRGDWP